ncbi:gamma-glutamyl-gamma-aminobutyrate hydrolase family protein [Camelliibacillus cellulosilyticus]|uniref:Gamma-glutamyl-gamma-aminobutyrate hydrolase family protein n=1 Tax=Camelliibacillus cellulosilyticus TaxID=2174486 RepID=A0ABV9GKP0_9BACL
MVAYIGVTANTEQKKLFVREEYLNATLETGGIPFITPYLKNPNHIHAVFDKIDGILLTGGDDIDPYRYGEEPMPGMGKISPERDHFEDLFIKEALSRHVPILAICRGMLMLNVAAGGTLYQDLATQHGAPLLHYQNAPRDHTVHTVQINKGTQLYQALGSETIRVNSFHHQAVKTLAPGFVTAATAGDNVIEAIENPNYPFVLGIQWHPGSLTKKEAHARGLFRSFIQAAEAHASSIP